MKHLKTLQELNEASENLNISDVRQRFIGLVQSRIDILERNIKITKQGEDYYDKLQERIDELLDLLDEMKNVV